MIASFLSGFRAGADTAWSAVKWLVGTAAGRQVMLAAIAVLGFWWSGQHGWDRGVAWQYARDRAVGVQATAAGITFHSHVMALNTSVDTDLTSQFKAIDITFDRTVQEITDHVTPAIDRRYPLPCVLVRVHDAAILGISPSSVESAACAADDAPAPTAASAFSRSEAEWGRYTQQLEAQNAQLRRWITDFLKSYGDWRQKIIDIDKGSK